MRFIKIIIFCICSIPAFADNVPITGPTVVATGAQGHYVPQFPGPLNSLTTITWNVTGGTIVGQGINPTNPVYCDVVWDQPGIGTIEVYEDLGGQGGSLNIQVGVPPVLPATQVVNYGTSPALLGMQILDGSNISVINWQYSIDGNTWINITSSADVVYLPSPVTTLTYYRAVLTMPGGTDYTDAVSVDIAPLTPGTITLVQAPGYNTIPDISTTPATGGYCYTANYQYNWEASVEGGEWKQIATTAAYPSNVPVIGHTLLRRSITCGGTTLYSNTLYITPNYTSVDFENLNYVRTIEIHTPGLFTWYQADQLTTDKKIQSTTYLDGMGRPVEKVDKKVSFYNGSWNDMVQYYEYDPAGRTTKNFLPYPATDYPGKFKPNAAGSQATFVQNKFGEPGGAPTYSVTDYDNSPLNRVKKAYAPGQSWAGSGMGVATNYLYNESDEKVHIWTLDYLAAALPVTSLTQLYNAGSLFKNETIDEKNKKVITYTDFSGNVILKKVQEADGSGLTSEHTGWNCTYYVYDDRGQLRYVITPKAVAYLDNNGWTLTQSLADELCFRYTYDSKGRQVTKKTPGVGEVQVVYDRWDRAAFSQDANQRTTNKWLAALYDNLDRNVSNGIIAYTSTRDVLQQWLDNTTDVDINPPPGVLQADPSYSLRQAGVQYRATNSITFLPGFSSLTDDDFSAEIVDGSDVDAIQLTTALLEPAMNFYLLTESYYDTYAYTGVKSFNNSSSFAYTAGTNDIEATQPASGTIGLLTGQKVRVLENQLNTNANKFLFTSVYYDAKARILQTLSDNARDGVDIATNQYAFDGELWSSFLKHMAGTTAEVTVTTKYELDKLGRITGLLKNYNNSFYKRLATYAYDEYGKLKTKSLAPGYNGNSNSVNGDMETLSYDYNIQGWLAGINKDFVLSTNNSDQWNHFFGAYYGYDNRDNAFAASQLNGAITGAIWRSQGDNAVRKYDYTYDNLGRFTSALFNQKKKPTDGWSNAEVDFSTYVQYEDGNGNLKSLKHMGVLPGAGAGMAIDDLQYGYIPITGTGITGNILAKVQDLAAGTMGAGNGKLNDFSDGSNPVNNDDYQYDPNGNLLKDFNKGIGDPGNNGVSYNFLDKPDIITVAGKYKVEYTYDAGGAKLTKKVTNLSVSPNTSTTTIYAGDFIYQDNDLQMILHEEGRVKLVTPANTSQLELNAGPAGLTLGSKQGVFEYFIKDNLGNTRTVLTEEVQADKYLATMEDANSGVAAAEEQQFGQVDNNGNPSAQNELRLTRDDKPTQWTHSPDDLFAKVAHLTAANASQKMGPNMILKVTAGDFITASADYYYFNNNDAGPTATSVQDLVTSFLNGILGNKTSDLSKANSSLINSSLSNSGDLGSFLSSRYPAGPVPTAPKAYLNIVFLDEQFKFQPQDAANSQIGSYFDRVSQPNSNNVKVYLHQQAPKNGWVFIYLSNESNENVYFDNFGVRHDYGRISEENHYYPHGLKIAGISSRALTKLSNKYGYQADFSEEEENTAWNEFDLRNYDPQIGRWLQADPYDEFASPFVGMGNDPVNNVDPDGGGIDAGGIGALIGTAAGFAAPYAIEWVDNQVLNGHMHIDKKGWWGALGAFVGAGIGFGLGESLFAHGSNGGAGFGAQTRAFYKGFFGGGNGWTYSSRLFDHGEPLDAATPNIWKDFGKLFQFESENNFRWMSILDFDSRNPLTRMYTTALVRGINVNRTIFNIPNYTPEVANYLARNSQTSITFNFVQRGIGQNTDVAVISPNGSITNYPSSNNGFNIARGDRIIIDPSRNKINAAAIGASANAIDFASPRRIDPDFYFRVSANLPIQRKIIRIGKIKIPLSRWKQNL